MPDEHHKQLEEKFDRFFEKYRLGFVIPLAICALTALKNVQVGVALLIALICFWVAIKSLGKASVIFSALIPKSFSNDAKKALQGAIAATVFLGGFAALGIILRSNNLVARIAADAAPDGMRFAFIDPTFALVCILCIWIYAVCWINW